MNPSPEQPKTDQAHSSGALFCWRDLLARLGVGMAQLGVKFAWFSILSCLFLVAVREATKSETMVDHLITDKP
ncbi:MAG: hypothetical protein P8L66_09245 [Rhodospirillaceae bacterium]|nr:hypothetical protein [Rhodospirillaceae bacterium]